MNNKMLIGGLVLVVILGGGYFFVKNGMQGPPAQSPETQPSMTATSPSTVDTSAPTAVGTSASTAETISVEGNEFAFTPSTITVKQGQAVTLTFKNTGKYPHNFTVSDLNVQTKTVKSGEQDTVTFTPDKTGSFTYVCTVPGHADKGMKGTITVQ